MPVRVCVCVRVLALAQETGSWKLVTDDSVKFGAGVTPFEVVSPILRGSHGLEQVKSSPRCLTFIFCDNFVDGCYAHQEFAHK